ncbi:MAG TPA: hypothetical protein VFL83_04110 [Anaeromyxobacter sp.]|nr:hypothetical protein [Anaeromyxobacter sp.]
MDAQHDHAPKAACLPSCPGWAEGALSLFAFQRRYAEMLEACRAAVAIEVVDVAPATAGVVVPEYLKDEPVVRVTMVVGRDTPEVLLDEWGIRCNLTFRGRRADCAFPWPSILSGVLRPPSRRRPRFGVIAGTEDARRPDADARPEQDAGAAAGAEGAPREPAQPVPPRRFGVIEGGKGKKE